MAERDVKKHIKKLQLLYEGLSPVLAFAVRKIVSSLLVHVKVWVIICLSHRVQCVLCACQHARAASLWCMVLCLTWLHA